MFTLRFYVSTIGGVSVRAKKKMLLAPWMEVKSRDSTSCRIVSQVFKMSFKISLQTHRIVDSSNLGHLSEKRADGSLLKICQRVTFFIRKGIKELPFIHTANDMQLIPIEKIFSNRLNPSGFF